MSLFCVGRPVVLGVGKGEEVVIDARLDPSQRFLCGITQSWIYIWSAAHIPVLLATVERNHEEITINGNNKCVEWKDNGSVIALQTTRGIILWLNVADSGQTTFDHASASVDAAIAMIIPPNTVTLTVPTKNSRLDMLKDHATCMVSHGASLILGTNDGYLLRTEWGNPQPSDSLSLTQILSAKEFARSKTAIKQILLGINQYYVLFETGYVALLTHKTDHHDGSFASLRASLIDLRTLSSSKEHVPVTTMSLTANLLALGLKSGDTIIYDTTTLQIRCTLQAPAVKGLGEVSCVQWTASPHVTEPSTTLAVGWLKRGFGVYNATSQRVLMTSFAVREDDDIATNISEPCEEGVTTLTWHPSGLSLNVSSNGSTEILIFSFARAAESWASSQDEATSSLLLGWDRVYLPGDGDWSQYPVAPHYLAKNAPLRFAAVSHDGRYVACAGRRGAALLDVATRKWKVFGDVKQEQEIECVGLQWIGRVLVLAGQYNDDDTYKLLYYPYHHLDRESLLHTTNLPSRPVRMDCFDNHIAVLCDNRTLMVLRISLSAEPSLTVKPEVAVRRLLNRKLAASITELPLTMRMLSIQQLDESVEVQQTKPAGKEGLIASRTMVQMLLRLQDRSLVVYHVNSEQVLSILPACDRVWIAQEPFRSRMPLTFWSVSAAQGLQIWQISGAEVKVCIQDRHIELGDEITILGPTMSHCSVVGVCRKVSRSNGLPGFSKYEIQQACQPLLPYALAYLLNIGHDEDAIAVAGLCERYRNFSYSLELMIHAALENEWGICGPSSVPGSNMAMLERVVALIRRFPELLSQIVVFCLRKIDISLWDAVFKVIGDPAEMFNDALSRNNLSIASSCILPVQHVHGEAVAGRAAFRLLQTALSREDFELAGEIVRFLRPWIRSTPIFPSMSPQTLSKDSVPVVVDGSTEPTDARTMTEADMLELGTYVVNVVGHTARKLLASCRLIELGNLSYATKFNLPMWLYREQNRAARILDWSVAMQAVCTQFDLSPPRVSAVISALEAYRDAVQYSPSMLHTPLFVTQTPKTPVDPVLCAQSHTEAHTLMNAFYASDCHEWALVLAAVLNDYERCLMVLRKRHDLQEHFASLLSPKESEAYRDLIDILQADAEANPQQSLVDSETLHRFAETQEGQAAFLSPSPLMSRRVSTTAPSQTPALKFGTLNVGFDSIEDSGVTISGDMEQLTFMAPAVVSVHSPLRVTEKDLDESDAISDGGSASRVLDLNTPIAAVTIESVSHPQTLNRQPPPSPLHEEGSYNDSASEHSGSAQVSRSASSQFLFRPATSESLASMVSDPASVSGDPQHPGTSDDQPLQALYMVPSPPALAPGVLTLRGKAPTSGHVTTVQQKKGWLSWIW